MFTSRYQPQTPILSRVLVFSLFLLFLSAEVALEDKESFTVEPRVLSFLCSRAFLPKMMRLQTTLFLRKSGISKKAADPYFCIVFP